MPATPAWPPRSAPRLFVAERLTELLQSKDPEVRAAAIRGVAGRDGVDPWPWPEPRPRPFP